MDNPLVTCPACDGHKGWPALVDGIRNGRRCGWSEWITCRDCEGVGLMPDADARRYFERKAAGDALKADRRARGLNIRQEAARLGVTPQEISRREQGEEPTR